MCNCARGTSDADQDRVTNLALDLPGRDDLPAMARVSVLSVGIAAGTIPNRDTQVRRPISNAAPAMAEDVGHAMFHDEPTKSDELLVRFVKERTSGRSPQ